MSIRVGLRHMARSAVAIPGIPTDAYRKSHEIDGVAGEQTDYPIMVEVRRDSGLDTGKEVFIDPAKCNVDFSDIRFTASDRITKLDHWLESIDRMPYWDKYAGNPILSPAGAEDKTVYGSVLKVGDTWHMYYTYHDGADNLQIGHATSPDGKAWTKDVANNPVFTKGAAGKFDDEEVWLSQVWVENSTWHMLYAGYNFSAYATGYATSADGITWNRQNDGDAVIEGTPATWDANQVEGSAIMKVGSTYYLWYTNFGTPRAMGLATSTNLIDWTKDGNNPIFDNRHFCPAPFKVGSYYYILVCQYETAPGESWSNIYLFRDTSPTFYSGERTLIGLVLPRGSGAADWDGYNLDVPFVYTDDINRDSYLDTGNELWCYYSGSEAPAGAVAHIGLTIEPCLASAVTLPAIFWVEVPTIPVTGTTIYIYYGKADAVSESDGEETFPLFDDFPGDTLDTVTKWAVVSAQPHSVAGGVLTITGAGDGADRINSQGSWGVGYALRLRSYFGDLGGSSWWGLRKNDVDGMYATWNTDAFTFSSADCPNANNEIRATPEQYVGVLLYNIWSYRQKTGSCKFYMNDGHLYNPIVHYCDNAKLISFRQFVAASAQYIDWTLIRKYVDPEPAHGDWDSEEGVMWPF